MVYVKQEWVGSDNPLVGEPGSTPITDIALNHLETQYDQAVAYVDAELLDLPLGVQYEQVTPLATWTWAHNFGRRPNVAIIVNDEIIDTDVIATPTNVTATFPNPTAGYAVMT